jgi:putative SOS response-associated peptidase YedK
MCGRFGFFELKYFIELLRQLELPFEEAQDYHFSPGYNITPESSITTLLGRRDKAVFTNAKWGLIPHWSKDLPKIRPINARAESLAKKPYFRHVLHHNHCLIPASGFYEWKQSISGRKQPWYIHRKDNSPLAFAGLWEEWQPPGTPDEPVISCTIITTQANREMKSVHDRMPVILQPDDWNVWLDAQNTRNTTLLAPSKDGTLELYPVSPKVNNPQYIRKDCIERVEQADTNSDSHQTSIEE